MKRSPQEQLVDATMLARFASLKESQVAEFRHSVAPDFVPAMFWRSDLWQREQELLLKAWRTRFPPELSVLMISHAAQVSEFAQRWKDVIEGRATTPLKPEVYPYQKAVMFLTLEPWRAAFCPQCGNPFVKVKKAQRYCSQECYGPHRAAAKQRYWQEKGNRRRRLQRRRLRGSRAS